MDIGSLLSQLPAGILVDHTAPRNDAPPVHRAEFYEGQRLDSPDTALLLSLPGLDQPETVRALEPLHPASLLIVPHHIDADGLEQLRHSWEQRGLPVPVTARKSRWVDWGEMYSLVSRMLRTEGQEKHGELPHESLSALADFVTEQSAASITIEDLRSQVLAYSSTDAAVDSLRASTILQRAIPRWRVQELMAEGFLPAIWRAQDVVERQNDDGATDRLVMPIRSQESTIGTVWAAPSENTDIDTLRDLLRDAAEVAAPLVLRQQVTTNLETHLHQQALHSLLSGEGHLRSAAGMLGLSDEGQYCVMAYNENAEHLDSVEFHLAAVLPGFRSTTLRTSGRDRHGIQHRVLLASAQNFEDTRPERIQQHLRRTLPSTCSIQAVIAPQVNSLSEISDAVREAQLGLQALELQPCLDPHPTTIRSTTSLSDSIELLKVVTSETVDAAQLCVPLDTLASHDAEHGTHLMDTVQAALAHPGNHSAAARVLNIHSNSLRYRLARIREISGIHLDEHSSRLRTELALLLRSLH